MNPVHSTSKVAASPCSCPNIAGKPEIEVDSRIINLRSGFAKKRLCDGPTFTAGSACVFRCTFCYVLALLLKDAHVRDAMKATGCAFKDLVIRRSEPLQKVTAALTSRGNPKFADPHDNRVIFASPLVDVAATMDLVKETAAICCVILELTNWQIRLLSKSPLLEEVARIIPEKFKRRVIYGFSTGTLDDGIARAIERGAPLVSHRIAALHRLQSADYRTFGMICPSLPQTDYEKFSRDVCAAIDVDRCEHVWAEALNARGDSLSETCAALRQAGYNAEAASLEAVSNDQPAWEKYAHATFDAHVRHVPAGKLRFLQYVTAKTRPQWAAKQADGAILLGRKTNPKASRAGQKV